MPSATPDPTLPQQPQPTLGASSHSAAPSIGSTPSQLGDFRILGVLGVGGMGSVYEAEQRQPHRRVALKVIRPGLTTTSLLRRFELEAEVLGRLQHPGIAQIYQAGTIQLAHEQVQPFFAMELVRGEPLTQYATKRNLGTRQRLALMIKVCEAVQHAHQQGVVHRDLKPSNILVTGEGEAAQPKVLDFGVARLTGSDIQTTTLQTDIGQLVGTVPYMSPEQACGDPDQIDTRSDVYALGVVCYELLAGRLPYDVSKKLVHEAVRIIREDEPTKLSSIDRALRGDVETIVGKALEKDRDRRYSSASALADDLSCYLRDEPIVARPAGTWYQVGKFAKRNKVLVGGVLATILALAMGLIGVTYYAANFRTQRDEAIAARAAEKTRADELKQVSDFQEKMLAQIDTTTAGVRLTEDVNARLAAALEKLGVPEAERKVQTDTFRRQWVKINATDTAVKLIDTTILKPAVKAIDEQFRDQPIVDAQLRQALASLYQSIGLYDAAVPLQASALAARRRVLGEEHPSTLLSISGMGILLQSQGKLAEAEPYWREALEMSRRVLGEEHPSTLSSINNMGALLRAQGKSAEAEPYYREALEKRRRVLGEDHPLTVLSITNMGGLLDAQGRLAEAELYWREALEKNRRVLGEEHPGTLNSISNMGSLLHSQGKLAEAEPYSRESQEKRRRVLGEEHPDTLTSINNLGLLLQDQGKLAEAEPYAREALEKSRRILGDEHPNTLIAIVNMGSLLQEQGKLAEAEPYYREALQTYRRVLGDEHPNTLVSINSMGSLLVDQGQLAEAEPYYREVLEKRRRVLGEEHPSTLVSIGGLGLLLLDQGKLAEAEPYYREALEKSRRVLGEEHPNTVTFINNMGFLLVEQGKLAEAEPYYREALEKRRRLLGKEHPSTLSGISNMGNLLRQQGKYVETIDLLTPAEPAARKAFTGGNARRLAGFLTALGRARVGLGYDGDRFRLAEANLLEAHPIYVAAKDRGPTHKDTLGCVQGLVDLYTAWDRAEPGKGYDAKAAEWKVKLDGRAASTS